MSGGGPQKRHRTLDADVTPHNPARHFYYFSNTDEDVMQHLPWEYSQGVQIIPGETIFNVPGVALPMYMNANSSQPRNWAVDDALARLMGFGPPDYNPAANVNGNPNLFLNALLSVDQWLDNVAGALRQIRAGVACEYQAIGDLGAFDGLPEEAVGSRPNTGRFVRTRTGNDINYWATEHFFGCPLVYAEVDELVDNCLNEIVSLRVKINRVINKKPTTSAEIKSSVKKVFDQVITGFLIVRDNLGQALRMISAYELTAPFPIPPDAPTGIPREGELLTHIKQRIFDTFSVINFAEDYTRQALGGDSTMGSDLWVQ